MLRPGYAGARALEFVEAGERSLVVGVYWVAEDGGPREPLLFQHVTVEADRIVGIRDYRRERRALRAARAA